MTTQSLVLLFAASAFVLAVIAVLGATLFKVEQRTTVIGRRFGNFLREAGPGFHVRIPFIMNEADRAVRVPEARARHSAESRVASQEPALGNGGRR